MDFGGNYWLWKQVQIGVRADLSLSLHHSAHNRSRALLRNTGGLPEQADLLVFTIWLKKMEHSVEHSSYYLCVCVCVCVAYHSNILLYYSFNFYFYNLLFPFLKDFILKWFIYSIFPYFYSIL